MSRMVFILLRMTSLNYTHFYILSRRGLWEQPGVVDVSEVAVVQMGLC